MKKAFMYFGFGHFLWLWGTVLLALMNRYEWISTAFIPFDTLYVWLNLGFLVVLFCLAIIHTLDIRF